MLINNRLIILINDVMRTHRHKPGEDWVGLVNGDKDKISGDVTAVQAVALLGKRHLQWWKWRVKVSGRRMNTINTTIEPPLQPQPPQNHNT